MEYYLIEALVNDRPATPAEVQAYFPDCEPDDPDAGLWLVDLGPMLGQKLEEEGQLEVAIGDLRIFAEML